MTLNELKTKREELLNAIKEYMGSPEYNEIDLEMTLDDMLTRLPRDIIYVEWFDRSDIKNMADGVYDDPASEDLVDKCMEDLNRFDGSIMQNETVEYIVADTVRTQHKGA